MQDRTMGKLVPLSAEQLQEIERMLREGAWTAETIEIFKAEIQSKPEDETDKGLLALCELALKGLDSPPPYVQGGVTIPKDLADGVVRYCGRIDTESPAAKESYTAELGEFVRLNCKHFISVGR